MIVKLTTARSSVTASHSAGAEIEVSAAEGRRLIETLQAVPVRAIKNKEDAARASQPRKTTSKRTR